MLSVIVARFASLAGIYMITRTPEIIEGSDERSPEMKTLKPEATDIVLRPVWQCGRVVQVVNS